MEVHRQWTLSVVVGLVLVTLVNVSAAAVSLRYGRMPHRWASWSQVAVGSPKGQTHSLGGVVGQVQHEAMPTGGPQGLEGYVYMDHARDATRLAIGTIGNVEHAGAGHVTEIRSLQGGGEVTGPGTVDRWVGLTLAVPHTANVREVVDIQFSNGWSLRANGDNLELWDTKGIVRLFR
jgi:hypothetical protein